MGFTSGASGKEHACQCRRCKRHGFDHWVRKIPWRRKWQPTAVFLPGEFHGERSLAGYSSWGHKELDMSAIIDVIKTASVAAAVLLHEEYRGHQVQWTSCSNRFKYTVI